MTQTS
jgi:hypothetical protein